MPKRMYGRRLPASGGRAGPISGSGILAAVLGWGNERNNGKGEGIGSGSDVFVNSGVANLRFLPPAVALSSGRQPGAAGAVAARWAAIAVVILRTISRCLPGESLAGSWEYEHPGRSQYPKYIKSRHWPRPGRRLSK